METVKKLLESTKQNLEMKLWWAEEHDKEMQFAEEIPKIKQEISDIDEALFRLFSVDFQSAQLCHCGNKEDSRYSPCCSLEHWNDRFS